MSCEKLGCTGSLNIGRAPHCGYLDLPFNATQNGVHYLEYDHNGYAVRVPLTGQLETAFRIDLSKLPEYRLICFKIIQPDGDYFSVSIAEGNVSPCDETVNDAECFYRFFLEVRPTFVSRDVISISDGCFALLDAVDLPITEIDLIDFANNNLLS